MSFSEKFLEECVNTVNLIDTEIIEKMVYVLHETRMKNGRLFLIGSGGGAGHSSHATCDFRKLCDIETYSPYDNVSELTARVNDEGWDTTIVNWLKVSRLKEDDCIFVFSVGGGNIDNNVSMNIVNALTYAKELNCKIIGIVGKDGGYTKKIGDAVVLIPVMDTNYITPITEGFQSIIWHLIVSHDILKVNKTVW